MLARTSAATDSISAMVLSSRSVRVARTGLVHGAGLCVVRLLWSTSSSFFHGGIAFIIAESEDVLQRNANVRQIFLDVGPSVIFLVKLRLVAQVVRELACALLQPQFDLLEDFRIGLDGLLELGSVGHPNGRDMDQDRHRRDRQRALRLVQAIATPIGLGDGFGDRAAGLLVEQRYPVRKSQQVNGLVLLRHQVFGGAGLLRFLLAHVAACVDFDAGPAGTAIRDRNFHLEWVAPVGRGRPGGHGKEIRLHLLVQPVQQLLLANRNDAICPRRLMRVF